MSDTPISDSTPHNVADLGMLCRKLERELNAATSEIARLTSKVAQLYEGAEEQNQRIKRLEKAGDALDWLVPEPPDRNCSCHSHISPPCSDCVNWADAREAKKSWAEVKEAKL